MAIEYLISIYILKFEYLLYNGSIYPILIPFNPIISFSYPIKSCSEGPNVNF